MKNTTQSLRGTLVSLFLLLTALGFSSTAHATFNYNTTTTVTGSPNPGTENMLVTFIADIMTSPTPGVDAPTDRSVTFYDGATIIGTVTSVRYGGGGNTSRATFTTSSLSVGTHSITATYSGDPGYTFYPSTSAVYTMTINAAPPTPAPAPAAQPTPSQQTPAVQKAITKTISQSTSQVVSSGLNTAMSAGFAPSTGNGSGSSSMIEGHSDGFTLNNPLDHRYWTAANDSSGVIRDSQPATPVFHDKTESKWSVWLDVRNSGWKIDNSTSDLKGRQMNITTGVSRKITPDFLGGVMVGYENADYDSNLAAANLKNNGVFVGPYFGYRFCGNMLVDGAVTVSKLKYDSSIGGVTGSFDSQRIVSALGLTGTYNAGAVVLSPSLRGTYVTEGQDQWTDSAAVVQERQTTTGGQGSFGAKAAYTIATDSNTKFSPYIGVYGDSFTGSDIETRTSGRATVGADAVLASGLVFHLGYENSGLGVDLKQWSIDGLVSVPF